MLLSAVAYGPASALTCIQSRATGRQCVTYKKGEGLVELETAVDRGLGQPTLKFCVSFPLVEGPVASVSLLSTKCGAQFAVLKLELRVEQGMAKLKVGGNNALGCPVTPIPISEISTAFSSRQCAIYVECDARSVRMRDSTSTVQSALRTERLWGEIETIRMQVHARTENRPHIAAACFSGATSKLHIREAIQMARDGDENARPMKVGGPMIMGMTQMRAEAPAAYDAMRKLA